VYSEYVLAAEVYGASETQHGHFTTVVIFLTFRLECSKLM